MTAQILVLVLSVGGLSYPGSVAHNISLATYTVEVHELRKPQPLFLKFKQGEQGATVHGALLSELTTLHASYLNRPAEKHLLKIERLESDATDIWGVIEAGEYGSEAKIVSAVTLRQTHLQSTNEARMNRFYFRLHLPNGAQKGLLVLQRTGPFGAFTQLHRQLEQTFLKKYEDYRLRFARAIDPEILAALLEGKIFSYHITTFKVPADINDYVKHKGPIKQISTITISATAKKGTSIWDKNSTPPWYKKVITDGKSISEVFPQEEIQSFKLTTEYKGQQRTFDLTRPDDIFPYVKITDEVIIGDDGHPTFDTIDYQAQTIRDDLRVKLGIAEPVA